MPLIKQTYYYGMRCFVLCKNSRVAYIVLYLLIRWAFSFIFQLNLSFDGVCSNQVLNKIIALWLLKYLFIFLCDLVNSQVNFVFL